MSGPKPEKVPEQKETLNTSIEKSRSLTNMNRNRDSWMFLITTKYLYNTEKHCSECV